MSPKIRRNDPCPCGSGKKYKKCCLENRSQQRQTTPQGRFRFEPGSYGHPERCMPSIACLRDGDDSSEYHFVVVKPDTVLDSPDRANAIATEDLTAAFSTKKSTGGDEAVAIFLRERGYVTVDDFNIVDSKSESTASWMDDDGVHFVAPSVI
ncbi:MAG: SEC-C metal-binding domain-containing protein [Myxococcota bacterium]|nr:SEC-C metal-binding domain-containing protein [Myxococcota bacterium]